ncbi:MULTISPECIES: KilA-N domain-containing protein [Klebsiella]|uniref:KilA-N domain-containing protein n=1 Tax=Klebsiella TaxID=570 RepID=UPI001660D47D|nr:MULTISPECIES: KilA-N domain-containing protein [Klebsiella]HBX1656958.1 KilA-N domain-containing protein [Klebsiella quasipneumoniae subsp. similipneumoniae]EKV3651125.1 KilA-N domain-containing protein [Klebsiella quasipneumoniae]MBD0755787.1 KilA-N domain-containing protein [Klebsiella quasipneumoniae]MDK1864628.1 KilA-N domain-containing protein [Klebsiella sp. K5-307]MDK1937003.1 KilA-N domain-containing protein [Klebsiella sp. K6-322]
MAEQFELIPRVEEGAIIPQRMSDGYINATALCQSVGKTFSGYKATKLASDFITEMTNQTGLSEAQLIHSIVGGNPKLQGTWVHPQLAINLAQWLSPKFAVKVSQWVYEWSQGQVKFATPTHLQRYTHNRHKVPHTHFSMLNEITLSLIAPLEIAGYVLPDRMIPDISEGRMFCAWLRKNRGIEPNDFPTYKHEYIDGRVVDAKLYPVELYADFRRHFHEIWLPQKAPEYFQQRDRTALEYLEVLMLPAPR